MLLFLDTISPIPEFAVIEDNKVILKQKITKQDSDKLSDNIIQSYIEIDNVLNLKKNLKKISVTIGPGSYTSLRVGSAFMSGLMISKNIPCYPFSVEDIFNFNSSRYNIKNLGVFVTSSNEQKFFCYINDNNFVEYCKVDESKILIPKKIEIIYFNKNKLNLQNNPEYKQFSFFEKFYENFNNLSFKKNITINPIYISNNKILN
tara:strand:- start:2866 stop:3477 length:612 start_codon:yes stop_codon:yes gene_type:complete